MKPTKPTILESIILIILEIVFMPITIAWKVINIMPKV
jgi:hypothetical protein